MALFNFHGSRKRKEIALTFDDAPSEETEDILKIFKKYNAKATFFVCGNRINGRQKILKKIVKDGHEIGNHGWRHKSLLFRRLKFVEEELKKCDDILRDEKITTNLFRPPYFRVGLNLIFTCWKMKKKIIFCDVSSNDWKMGKTDEEIVERVLLNIMNGSIVNLHDYLVGIGRNKRIIAISKKILESLSAKGYKFVTVSKILE